MKSNLISNNQNNKNHSKNKYIRCASVEEKINNPRFSHNLEKEFLDVKFIVKDSVEKINTLFNNKEFKQRTSKKIYNNNINLYNLNNIEKKDNNKDKNNDKLKFFFNGSQTGKVKINRYSVNEEDEFIYNSNELFKELKDLNSNKSKNNDKFNNKYSLKTTKSIDLDSISISLLNLESNKLYSKKERNLNLKKINISESANLSKKNRDRKNKNQFNYMKEEMQNDIMEIKGKKKDKDILKYIHKGNNKNKKIIQNEVDLKTRNINKVKVFSEKNIKEDIDNFNNTNKLKKINNSLQNHIKTRKKNNSNSMLIDINYKMGTDNNNFNRKENKDDNCYTRKNLNKKEIKVASLDDIENKEFENIIKINKNTNIFNTKKIPNKIKTQDFIKMMLIFNEYLITNNLFEDYSNPKNKKLLNDYSLFLLKNAKINHTNNNQKENSISNNSNDNNKLIPSVIKIQRKWRKIKLEKYLINNFMEEEFELRKMLINSIMEKSQNENFNVIDIFNNVINNCNLINNKIEDIEQIFDLIRKLIKRNLTIDEKNILYKEYINRVICKK